MSSSTYIIFGLLVIAGWVLFMFRKTFFGRRGEQIPDSDAKSESDTQTKQEKEVTD
ncbi:MAG: hypothetical protein JST46_15090 [Bacteroidetes bacterium]|nr:hypothetical protein [Bacteroidota bacterium]